MITISRDELQIRPSMLLDLDGQVLTDPEGGHWVRFVVTRVLASPEACTASTTR